MLQCPVCDTEYMEGETQRCSVCGWDLIPPPDSKYSKVGKAFLEKQKVQLDWARKMWVRYQAIAQEMQHSNSMPPRGDRVDLSELNWRFDQLNAELQQGKEERRYLQSQLDWVIARLDPIDFEQMQQILWQLSAQFNPAATPDYSTTNSPYSATPETYYPSSEVGIDYNNLMKLLSKGKWKKADEETWALMLKASDREEEGWLSVEDIRSFPPTDLIAIDWVWEEYSYGRFGFNIQQQIWESVEGDYTAFCDRVGWRVQGNWLYYDELRFSLDAPEGHLPAIGWRKRPCYGVGKVTAQESVTGLLQLFNALRV